MQLIRRTSIAAVCLAALSTASLVCTSPAQAWTYKKLYDFTPGSDGFNPIGLFRDESTGNFYGVTALGGYLAGCNGQGCGVVYRLRADGNYKVLYSFTGGSDGGTPRGAPIRDRNGNLYGTTISGGDLDCGDYHLGCGVIFKLGSGGEYSVLHTFHGSDGSYPTRLMQDASTGEFYGTTTNGGSSNRGTVFSLAADETYKVLHSFAGGSDGAYPQAALIRDHSGYFYGTTNEGGEVSCGEGDGCGTVFKIAPDGSETVLYAFTRASQGYPYGGVVRDNSGNLYGTGTGFRGYHGSVFRLSPDGKFKVLHAFTRTGVSIPVGDLLLKRSGALYGTASRGGGGGGGVFRFRAAGTYEVIHSFTYNDGYIPGAGVIQDRNGNLYGTTVAGGTGGYGTVFELEK